MVESRVLLKYEIQLSRMLYDKTVYSSSLKKVFIKVLGGWLSIQVLVFFL